MANLKDTALNHQAKKELSDLPSISVDIEVKEDVFKNKEGKDIKYQFIEIDGYRYALQSKTLSAIKRIIAARPSTKNIKVEKATDGELFVVPLD